MSIGLLLASLGYAAPAVATPCPNEQLRTESNVDAATGVPYSEQLPDCRAYELVSPPETGGWEVPAPHLIAGQGAPGRIVANAETVFFESQTVAPGTGAIQNGDYLRVFRSHRTSAGWVTHAILPTALGGNMMLEGAASAGARALIKTSIGLVPEDIDNRTNNTSETGYDLYIGEENGPPRFVSHGTLANEEQANAHGRFNYDMSAVAFETGTSLAIGNQPGENTSGCYSWDDDGDRLAEYITGPFNACIVLGATGSGLAVIEAGDQHIYATDQMGSFPSDAKELSGEMPGAFDGMSPDDETVYFTTHEPLTANAVGDTGTEIYAVKPALAEQGEMHLGAPGIECLSCEAAGVPNSGNVTWVAQSGDGSHILFRLENEDLYEHDATGTHLVAPGSDQLGTPVPSYDGKYVVAPTSAALSPSDTDGDEDLYLFGEGASPTLVTSGIEGGDYLATAVADNGQRVVYEAGRENEPHTVDEWSAGETAQISPLGSRYSYSTFGTAGPEVENVFFESHDTLVPADLNGGTTDIYDARADGGFPAPSTTAAAGQTPNLSVPAVTPYSENLEVATTVPGALPPDTSTPTHTSAPAGAGDPRSQSRAMELTRALKACRRDRSATKRRACEHQARIKYGRKTRQTK